MPTVSGELRAMLPVWALSVLLPVPLVNFWRHRPGSDLAYGYLFLGAALLAADRFAALGAGFEPSVWRIKTRALWTAGAINVAVFTMFVWAVTAEADLSVPLFASLATATALCCAPFLAIATGSTYLAVFGCLVLVAAIKMAGCVVVVLVYGWHAQEHGYTTLPWTQPNLLVWLCLAGAAGCSVVLYETARRSRTLR
jgi:hypothetical protein